MPWQSGLPVAETAVLGCYAPYAPIQKHHTKLIYLQVLWETLRGLKRLERARTVVVGLPDAGPHARRRLEPT